jgi:hypothetical protein
MAIRRQTQEVGHCGPTCVAMLLEAYGVHASQQEIAAAAGVEDTIARIGSRIDQLAAAVTAIAPAFVTMGMYGATVRDLASVTNDLGLAVGVEWQSTFRGPSGDFDVGHYSLVVSVDEVEGYITLIDPDDNSHFAEGRIAMDAFERRWWEDNELEPGKKSRSWRLAFTVVPAELVAPLERRGFVPMSFDVIRAASTDL